jgi:hypothetical protein
VHRSQADLPAHFSFHLEVYPMLTTEMAMAFNPNFE